MQQEGASSGETFHTHLLAPFDASAGEVFFFAQLDAQLNKVSRLAWVKAGAACISGLKTPDLLRGFQSKSLVDQTIVSG